MKNPFTDFEFKFNVEVFEIELRHKNLPITFKESLYFSKGVNKKEIFEKGTNKLYTELYMASVYGKTTKPRRVFHSKIYFPQWDDIRKEWFVMDDFENLCYNYNEIKTPVSDELNVD